ncbi:hypothetical protein CRENBAI_004269 [Crenichthys baileyi]|uniref:Uncharacterized protein n=1 Tax=Crenichthys baileyi TaxID=28760 RepID=A0AAV9RZP2_9TELE
MIIAVWNVSIDNAIVDTLRAIERHVRIKYAEHSNTQYFSPVWHNPRVIAVMFSVSPSTVHCGQIAELRGAVTKANF